MSSDPQTVRFQIASRLGGFRDTATIPDPFGTSAQFVIYRADSNAHRAWARGEMDRNPVVTEIMLGIESPPPALSSDDEKIVTTLRAKVDADDTARLLVPIIDRLTAVTIERNLEREATKRALTEGKVKASDVMFQGMDQQLKEGKFILKDWSNLPADDGSTITFSIAMREALLTNDTPLDGEEVQALLLKQDCWTYKRPLSDDEIDQADGTREVLDVEDLGAVRTTTPRTIHYKLTVLPSVTTLGRAYLLYFLAKSRETALFRNAVMEAAGKNSAPSSDSITSSGDGTSGAETPN